VISVVNVLFFYHRVKFTNVITDAALNTLGRIDLVRLFGLTGDGLLRTFPEATVATRA
jgi:hypothetical protein